MSSIRHTHASGTTVEALATDPTRTITVRTQYARRLRGALRRLRSAMREGIVNRDAFGLESEALADPPEGFDFPSRADKERAFSTWWERQSNSEILDVYGDDNQYISRAYERGIKAANRDLNRAAGVDDVPGVEVSMQLPEHRDTIEAVFVRNFSQLEGLTSSIGQDMSRRLAEGLAAGENPRTMASDLADIIGHVDDGTARGAMGRANAIARTETLNAHHESWFTQAEDHGAKRVKPLLGPDPCEVCLSIAANAPYPIKEGRSIWPAHPNCVCSPTIAAP